MSKSPSSSSPRDGPTAMDDPENTTVTVGRFVDQLHANMSSPVEKELITARLLGIAKARKDARKVIGSHTHAIPLLMSILRDGTHIAKVNVAATLIFLCKDEELRLKVLLGGCIQPLMSLLKSSSIEARRVAAEAISEVSAGGLSDDPVGMKIFVTEGVVQTLWDELNKKKQDKAVLGFITGALRNLCGDKDGHWTASLKAGGVDIIVPLLYSDNAASQSSAASLLARMMWAFNDSITKVVDSGAVKVLVELAGQENDISVRASAAEALEALLSSGSDTAKKAVTDQNGVNVLIGAVVAPSKEGIQGEMGQALQRHAARALASIFGGLSPLIQHLGELSLSPRLAAPVPDILGALAYTLMLFEESSDSEEDPLDATKLEDILVRLLKPRDNKLFQERVLEAMASLYGNTYLSKFIDHAEGKGALVGLATLATGDVQENVIRSISSLCSNKVGIWEAIGKKEGIQLPISFLGSSSELHHEYAIKLLAILAEQVDDSKWAITAAGGIPQVVQILHIGSPKAKEDALRVLWNLSSHSEDIRACVETAGAVPALTCLLRDAGPKGQEAATVVLKKVIQTADSATINELVTLLNNDSPSSKTNVLEVLGHVLGMASDEDLVQKGSAANKGLRSVVKALKSSTEETQQYAASVLADLFTSKADICESLATEEVIDRCIKLLSNNSQIRAKQSMQALGDLYRSTREKDPKKKAAKNSHIAEGDLKNLIKLVRTSSIDDAETAVTALANHLSDPQIAEEALEEDVVSALTRVLGEGSLEGKKNASRALYQVLKQFPAGNVLRGDAQCRFAVLALLDSLNDFDMNGTDAMGTLKVVALLAKTKQGADFTYTPLSALDEVPSSIEPLMRCLTEGPASLQDKAIEVLSRLCGDHPGMLGDLLMARSGSISLIANRIMNTSSLDVKVGGAALLICAVKGQKQKAMDALEASGYVRPLVFSLVDMTKPKSNCSSLRIELGTRSGFMGRRAFQKGNEFDASNPTILLGGHVALWLLSIISSFREKNKIIVKEAGGIETLCDKLASRVSNPQVGSKDTEGIWISSLLLAILFQDSKVVASPSTARIIPSLSHLLTSDEVIEKFFAAQALASLVTNGSKGISAAISNPEAVAGLISLIGCTELETTNLVALSEEFCLVRNPDKVILENLFEIEDVRVGSIAQNSIPLLVDLLRPTPGRLAAPPFAVELLTRIADASDKNKLAMAESGVLDALTKYLSLSPHEVSEASISELMNILFSSSDLICKASVSTLSQLIAVLHMGSRKARLSSVKALNKLFDAEKFRDAEAAKQAVQPLVDMLDTALESDQELALSTLIKLTSGDYSKSAYLIDLEGDLLGSLYRIMSSAESFDLRINAAQLCYVLFANPKGRANPMASEFIEPLIALMQSDSTTAAEHAVCAFERLLDDDQQAEQAASLDVVDLLVGLVSGTNHRLTEASIYALIKLGKDRSARKLDMVKVGVIDNCIEILPVAPSSLCSSIAELFRILTNSSSIARSSTAARIVEPLFTVLLRPDFSLWGQHSALQALLNVLEKPQSLETLELSPSQIMEPLIPFLESPSQAIQQLASELLSNLLEQEHFQQDIMSTNAVASLVKLAGIGILNLQQTAILALEKISSSWPKVVADAGGINEVSKIIIQDDPLPSDELWESAAVVLSNILCSDSEYYFQVPLDVLVGLLNSTLESIITLALNALIIVERNDASSAEQMTEAGAVDALLDLIRSHQCEEESARLLEALLNNVRVREMRISRYAIAPLAQYLLDPQTVSESCKLLAALCLGNLSQQEGLAKSSDSVSACRALISLLEDQPTEEMKIVATCALQNFVIHSRANRRAVAEAGGIYVIQDLLLSSNSELAGQAALLIKFLFCNYTLQEFVSNELVRCLTAALERQLQAESTVNEEILRSLHVILSNFPKLHVSEAVTLCIPHLIEALKSGSDAAQASVLDILWVLKQSWLSMPIDISKSQAAAAAEAVPVLQMLVKTGPSFRDRADNLLHCLPGCLMVRIIRGNNLKQSGGSTNAFCQLQIGSNGTPKQTKVVNNNNSPEWDEAFTWTFDVPPRGQKLHITCKSKTTFGKSTLGKVNLQIDKVISEGECCGLFNLARDSNDKEDDAASSACRTLELEIIWSHKTSSNQNQ